jgi:hypothetical protein
MKRTSDIHPFQITDVGELTPGDLVEARRNSELHYRGCVEDSAAALGVVWIRDDLAGHRALLHLDHYAVWQVPAPQPQALPAARAAAGPWSS